MTTGAATLRADSFCDKVASAVSIASAVSLRPEKKDKRDSGALFPPEPTSAGVYDDVL